MLKFKVPDEAHFEKEPLLALFAIFLADFTLNLPFIKKEFSVIYPQEKDAKEDFYTFSYCIYFFEQKFRGIVEIKSLKNVEIKIVQEDNFYETVKLLPLGAQKIILENFMGQIFKNAVKKMTPKKKPCLEKEEIVKTVIPPYFLNNALESHIFQIIVAFYLQTGKTSLNLNFKDILKFKKISKEQFEQALSVLEKHNLIIILNKTDFDFQIIILYFEAEYYSLPSKIFSLNLKTQVWQRKIGEFLYYKNEKFIKIKEILNVVKNEFNALKPSQIRTRLEDTLDSLQALKIIKGWEYRFIKEENLQNRNWFERYKNLSIKWASNF